MTYYHPYWVDEDGSLREIGDWPSGVHASSRKEAAEVAHLMGVGHDPTKGWPEWTRDSYSRKPWTGKKLKIVEVLE